MYIEIMIGLAVFFLFVIAYALRVINHNILSRNETARHQHSEVSQLLRENISELQKARLRVR